MLITRYSQPVRGNGDHADSLASPTGIQSSCAALGELEGGVVLHGAKIPYVSVYAPGKGG